LTSRCSSRTTNFPSTLTRNSFLDIYLVFCKRFEFRCQSDARSPIIPTRRAYLSMLQDADEDAVENVNAIVRAMCCPRAVHPLSNFVTVRCGHRNVNSGEPPGSRKDMVNASRTVAATLLCLEFCHRFFRGKNTGNERDRVRHIRICGACEKITISLLHVVRLSGLVPCELSSLASLPRRG